MVESNIKVGDKFFMVNNKKELYRYLDRNPHTIPVCEVTEVTDQGTYRVQMDGGLTYLDINFFEKECISVEDYIRMTKCVSMHIENNHKLAKAMFDK